MSGLIQCERLSTAAESLLQVVHECKGTLGCAHPLLNPGLVQGSERPLLPVCTCGLPAGDATGGGPAGVCVVLEMGGRGVGPGCCSRLLTHLMEPWYGEAPQQQPHGLLLPAWALQQLLQLAAQGVRLLASARRGCMCCTHVAHALASQGPQPRAAQRSADRWAG